MKHRPTISIDRQAKSWAVFDGLTCVKGFVRYENEATALALALKWCDDNGLPDPSIVYPRITSIRISS